MNLFLLEYSMESKGSRWTFSPCLTIEIVDLEKTSHVQGGPGNSV